jgi:hypothetical protein
MIQSSKAGLIAQGTLDTGQQGMTFSLRNKQGTLMAASSRLMIGEAERRFPVRIRIGVPAQGLGGRLDELRAWLDDNCGAEGWAMTPSGLRGVVNDAVAVYFCDAALASGFVARWCQSGKVETVEGVFRIRDDAPAARRGAPLHRTPAPGGGRGGE